jgi:hypothetical protein
MFQKYFGGLDRNGKTSAYRKEPYHNRICDMIKNKNGMLQGLEPL